MTLSLEDFEKVELRLGTIVRAELNEKAKKPAYKLWVDLGDELGVKPSSAQLVAYYTPETLVGKRVLCVCNFAPRNIAGFESHLLVTGFYDAENKVVLATVDALGVNIPNGARLL